MKTGIPFSLRWHSEAETFIHSLRSKLLVLDMLNILVHFPSDISLETVVFGLESRLTPGTSLQRLQAKRIRCFLQGHNTGYHTWQSLRNHSMWPRQTFLFCFSFKGTHSRRQVQFFDIMATRHLMGPFPLVLASHHIISSMAQYCNSMPYLHPIMPDINTQSYLMSR